MIREIASLLGISIEYAWRVWAAMSEKGIDFSECTRREFNRVARETYKEVASHE